MSARVQLSADYRLVCRLSADYRLDCRLKYSCRPIVGQGIENILSADLSVDSGGGPVGCRLKYGHRRNSRSFKIGPGNNF